ncbi:3-phosphoshikimate 1-carboxyvinyltransferase [Shimazuella sp. AN120528]|uniref:3-phosphoshikimate 1-carboxyvinyltransferase n=1 Tax=Shimazuella soli TaxID=1892854 RepID=UPI001F0D53D2|nr:3-phosphoshikimate 1-carboxyvinyltransferase [Shimazuella soli]MCH5585455.1 3-phosphoshikimate 1-carboxyvinyltransferase [Shimazuella soli]
MSTLTSNRIKPFRKVITVPGDKSISHRAIMFGSLAKGITTVEGFLPGADCLSTIACFEKLGVQVEKTSATSVRVIGKSIDGLQAPISTLDVGNSGTTIRLMMGILAGTSFTSILEGDASIGRRPMDRVAKPLRMMGAKISGKENGKFTPLTIKGTPLQGIIYESPVSSAQVKSAILLAGLSASGKTTVLEPTTSRDHTERMLSAFGVQVERFNNGASIEGGQELTATKVIVPGDISSAAFFLAAALMVPGSTITIENVGLNPTRTGIIDVFKAMGAQVTVEKQQESSGEPIGSITITCEELKGVEIGGDLIPRLIDEIPIIAVVATQAKGKTVIRDAAELKVKETNRISTTANELRKLGAQVEETEDGLIIEGKTPLRGAICSSYGDHRIGMAMAIAGLAADEPVVVDGSEAIQVSFPGFYELLKQL